ncbi:hypothetical protein CYMTET_31324, partial [Cymbomonas tetramitiformis]
MNVRAAILALFVAVASSRHVLLDDALPEFQRHRREEGFTVENASSRIWLKLSILVRLKAFLVDYSALETSVACLVDYSALETSVACLVDYLDYSALETS